MARAAQSSAQDSRARDLKGGRFASGACEAIVEFRRMGRQVKVSALDPVSLTEVSIIAPAGLGERQMADSALRKLDYVLSRTTVPRAI